jgi:two-component system, OmpR family, response regulator
MNDAPVPPLLSVLIVEDVADAADSLAILLRLHGDRVRVARTGPDALTACRESLPDLILLDIGLPGLDGWEVARQLRQMPGERLPFLVAVTGYGRPEDVETSTAAGIDLHLTKPVDPTELVAILDRFRRVVG